MKLQNRSWSSHHSQRPNHDQVDTDMNEAHIDIINIKNYWLDTENSCLGVMKYLELLAVQNMSKLNVKNLVMVKISYAQNTVWMAKFELLKTWSTRMPHLCRSNSKEGFSVNVGNLIARKIDHSCYPVLDKWSDKSQKLALGYAG